MSSFIRFFSLGLRQIDDRVAAALTPPSLEGADGYLRESAIVRAIDRATMFAVDAWTDSRVGKFWNRFVRVQAEHDWPARYRLIGSVLIAAIAVHLGLTLMQGPRPGWFWLFIPSMSAVFAAVLLAAASAAKR